MSQAAPNSLSFLCFITISALFTPSICIITIPQIHMSKIKGMFVFGSSVVDNGNNNFLPNSIAKVNYTPYGVDFPLGPTGRFSNGRNVADIIAQNLQIPNFIPPFLHPSTSGSQIVNGVNYGSGGSGILDNTGQILVGGVISLNQQIRNFENVTLPDLRIQLSDNSTRILSKYLFLVASGGNDYSLNYFRGLSGNVSLEQFTNNLTATLSHQLKMLYDLGARKLVLLAINPNGCSPVSRARIPTQEGCDESSNRAFRLFNSKLRDLALEIRPLLPGSNLVFVDTYTIISQIIGAPILQGFRDVTNSCCEVTQISEGGAGILCKRGGSVCTNRNEYVFFDGVHTTEAVNAVIGNKAFLSPFITEVYPFNVKILSLI